jgi:hypothetical protein
MRLSDLHRRVLAQQKIDDDAKAFLNAAQITDKTITKAINDLVIGLKNNNLWAKLNVIYPFVGGTASTHKWNLKDPRDLDVAFRASFFGTVTHSNAGVVGDGSTGYYRTFIVNNTHIKQNDHSFFVYVNNNIAESGIDFGFRISEAATGILNNSRNATNQHASRSLSSTNQQISNNNSIGFYGFSRNINTNYNAITNASITNFNVNSLNLANIEIYGLARNANNTSTDSFGRKRQAFFSFGDGLTNTEMTNLNNLVVSFQTTLGR